MTAPTIPSARPRSGGEPAIPTSAPEAATERRDGGLIVASVIAAVALLASIAGIGFGMRAIDESKANAASAPGAAASSATNAPAMVDVSLAEFSIAPKVIEVAAGGMLMVTNKGTMQHNLRVDGQELRTAMLDTGQEA